MKVTDYARRLLGSYDPATEVTLLNEHGQPYADFTLKRGPGGHTVLLLMHFRGKTTEMACFTVIGDKLAYSTAQQANVLGGDPIGTEVRKKEDA